MWTLELPTYSAKSAFNMSISRVRDQALAERLARAEPAVTEAEDQFDQAARSQELHNIHSHIVVEPDITKEEMGKVYTLRMAKNGAPGRII